MRAGPWLARGIGLCLGAILVWQAVAEAIEPYYTRPLLSLLRARPSPVEVSAVGATLLRAYADSRPHVGKITGLQKGLVWVADGVELVEEGYGLGCPLLLVDGLAYASRSAVVSSSTDGDGQYIVKRFSMDTVDTPISLLRRKYRPVPTIGDVVFRYGLSSPGTIDVHVDLSGISAPWQRAYLMNEQGAHRFTSYWDSDGLALSADELSIWRSTSAQEGCFRSRDARLSFCVRRGESGSLYHGRERYLQYNWRGVFYLSWSGVDIEIEAPRTSYRYEITLESRP